MKIIARKPNTSLYLKIFQSQEFDCTIFVYVDKQGELISLNYHWGTNEIKTKYMEFNGNGEVTQLYKLFLKIMGSRSAKIYDLVIGAHSLNSPRDLKIAKLETDLASAIFRAKSFEDGLAKSKVKLQKIQAIAKKFKN